MDFTRHLLIDGYNVIHDSQQLRSGLRRGGAVARERLAEAVRVLHDRERLRVTIVFDGRGKEIEVERPGGHSTFSYVFSPAGMSADDVIERMIGAAKDTSIYIVVTRDLAERRTIEALGATGMSPDDLWRWVECTERLVGRDLAARRRDIDQQWKNRDHREIFPKIEDHEPENLP